jgi:8-oxo-dGTP diphosphatase/2-hydroxy-dATP diphosphatase
VETEEMKPEWFSLDKIPYEQMWESDEEWLKRVLN